MLLILRVDKALEIAPVDRSHERYRFTSGDWGALCWHELREGSRRRGRSKGDADVTERHGGAPDGLIGRAIGHYIVRHKLAVGGTGSVYIAEHPLIGKRVALKILHVELAARPDIVGRFFNEARAVNDIQHPNIVDVVDFGVIEATSPGEPAVVYLLMEYLDGENLGRWIRRDAPLPPPRALAIALQIADALAASHAKGIVHRDLKPDNVMLVSRGREHDFVKILDFGIAKLTVQAFGSQRTQTGVVIGTPQYMSPEQCEGRSTVDHRTDIYALGVVLYEMLTGRVPFRGESFTEVLVQALHSAPVPPSAIAPGIPPHVERAVLRALAKRPEDRFQHITDLVAALQDPAWQEPVRPAASHGGSFVGPLPRDPGRDGSFVGPLPRDPGRDGSFAGPLPRDPAAIAAAARPTVFAEVQHPVPTTLNGTAAQSMALSARRGMPVAVAVSLAAVLAVAGASVGIVARRPAAPVEAAAKVRVQIDSTPPGATVAIDGRRLGVTPFTGELDRRDARAELELSLPGYQTAKRTVALGDDLVLTLPLDRAPEPPAPRSAKPRPDPVRP